MGIPSLMAVLSLAPPAAVTRWADIVAGTAIALIIAATRPASRLFTRLPGAPTPTVVRTATRA